MSMKGLTGNLKTMSLPDLLQWAGAGRKTGTLALKSGPLHKKIYFQDGAIIGSSSDDSREYLGQFMLSEGIITEQQLKDAFDLQSQTKVMLGRILVKKGLVSEAKVGEVLRLKAEETIYSLFLWMEADFEFLEAELPPGDQVLISIKVEDVLMEGLRRYDTSKKIRQVLPHNGVVLRRCPRPLPSDIAAKKFPRRIYDLVDGRRTLAQIVLEAHASEYNVCQVLFVMVQKKFLEIVQAESVAPSPARPPADSPQALMDAAKELIKSGDSEGALVILEKARKSAGKNPEMNALIQVAEEHFIDKAYRHYLPPKKIPVLKKPLESLMSQDLSPEEGFLVSRVNGSWDLRSIISISPLREVDALRAFKKLRERGILDLIDAQARTA
ncbi:MAG TPA: DUF4388 domain-containing protein [Candidatus Polarisedimenticolia bacterium]|jgi:hypothetical protein|nr:DUF4388 domain-containing protein [Candidatus Polarisedimenticolia bacterium]